MRGGAAKSYNLSLEGGGVQKVLDSQFSHFVAALPIISDWSLSSLKVVPPECYNSSDDYGVIVL